MNKKGSDIAYAAEMLKSGKLVGIPTETVYGLAGNAFDAHAVVEIFNAKKRPAFDPLIVHTHSLESARELVSEIPEFVLKLAHAFWPGPLTLLMPRNANIHDLITNGSDLVGIRVPNHPLTLQLLKSLDFPLVAPSANPFGYISPTRAEHVEAQLGSQVAYILDGGMCTVGLESTVVGLKDGKPTIFRKGGISQSEIESVIGSVEVLTHSSSNPSSPGMLIKHYSPRIPLVLGNIPELIKLHADKNLAVLSFKTEYRKKNSNDRLLSPKGSTKEAAVNLFAYLRELDELPIDLIITEYLPNEGLGSGINDRLSRAAADVDTA